MTNSKFLNMTEATNHSFYNIHTHKTWNNHLHSFAHHFHTLLYNYHSSSSKFRKQCDSQNTCVNMQTKVSLLALFNNNMLQHKYCPCQYQLACIWMILSFESWHSTSCHILFLSQIFFFWASHSHSLLTIVPWGSSVAYAAVKCTQPITLSSKAEIYC